MAQAAYSWPDADNFAAAYVSAPYIAASAVYGPGSNTSRGYEPFQTVVAGVGPGSTCRALLVGGKRRAIRISSPAVPG